MNKLIVLIITNHYSFLNNNNQCVDFFKKFLKTSKNFKIFYDQSYFVKKDYSNQLSSVLNLKVNNSGLFFWKNIIENFKNEMKKYKKIEVYFEGLFSPFQKEIFFNLRPIGVYFYCYSVLMPFFFQKINLNNGKIVN